VKRVQVLLAFNRTTPVVLDNAKEKLRSKPLLKSKQGASQISRYREVADEN